MPLKVLAVNLHVVTSDGKHADFFQRFEDQLVIIRGKNTVGKSLFLQSLLYGLGLEALYATRKGVLTRAMTSAIDIGGQTYVVSESWVELVIQNTNDQVMTVRRSVRTKSGRLQETDLVRTWSGDQTIISSDLGDRPPSDDYLAARPGAASDVRGFYVMLVEFIGWKLPSVLTYDERFVPLYLQIIFGLSYVDQKRGWGGTVPQVPTQFGVVEPLRRAVEFSLDLDVLKVDQRRHFLLELLRNMRAAEARLRGRLEAITTAHGGRITLSPMPASTEPFVKGGSSLDNRPLVEVLKGDDWVSLETRLDELRVARALRVRARFSDVRQTGADVGEAESDLRGVEQALAEASARLEALNRDEELLHMQMGALGRRLSSIDDEHRKYSQLTVLRGLGSEISASSMDDDCPTCRQPLESIQSIEGNSLAPEETRAALSQDRITVRNLMSEAETRLEAIDSRRSAWSRQASALRMRIRAIKSDLTAATGTPSAEVIQIALQDEQELSRLTTMQAQYTEDAEEWTRARSSILGVQGELRALGSGGLSVQDDRKLEEWTGLFRKQLSSYGFESAQPDEIDFDAAMKPTVDGYDIGFQGSASDGIRLRWAYLFSLMELSHKLGSPHSGLLMLDEPGQQGVIAESLGAMYQHAFELTRSSGQVFLTSSEPREVLASWLGNDGYTLVDLGEGRLLQAE